ncbi:MAG: glycosyltransferase family 4 protein [Chloroflexi bacterium]|nr:glycosyltransferase family 4 protein [Chloroflexota bacterium]
MQGGVADYTRELASSLNDLGVETSILTSARAGADHRRDDDLHLPEGANRSDPWPVYSAIQTWNFRSWTRILGHLNAIQPDVVHIQYQTGAYAMHPAINLFPLWLRRQHNHPAIVTTLHDTLVPYLFPKAGGLRHKVTLAIVRGSDRVIVTNEEDWGRVCMLTRGGMSDGNSTNIATPPCLRLVPIGSNIPSEPPEDFDRLELRTRLGVQTGEVLLSYFGFLNHSKGVDTLLESLRALVTKKNAAKLVMVGAEVGSSDPTNIVYRRKIVREIAELGLEDRVIWTGYGTKSEVSAHLLASDICVLPFRDGASFRRGTLIAALAHGLAIVSTRRGPGLAEGAVAGDVERLVHGKHALLVEPADPEALKLTIEELIRQPELRSRLGDAARQLAEHFTWPSIAKRTVSIYEELFQG